MSVVSAGQVKNRAKPGDILRFASRDHFAAYNGTAPAEVSSRGRKTCRLSLRGNRRANPAIHMAVLAQIRNSSRVPGSRGVGQSLSNPPGR